MSKKIKFPLEMANEVKVRTLEELRENFDLEKILAYYVEGKLLTWLNDRYYETEAQQISQLDSSSFDFKSKLCEIMGVDIKVDCEIDFEVIERRNAKLAKLKQFTADAEIIKNVDSVAFDQEEMSDLLDDEISPIYLCGDKFTIPLSRGNITYIGVNSPALIIKSQEIVDFAAKKIQFQNVTFNEEYRQLIKKQETVAYRGSGSINGVYKTSHLFDYMMNDKDRVASAKLFKIVFDELAALEFDIDKRTKQKVKILQEASLDKVFEKYLEKIR